MMPTLKDGDIIWVRKTQSVNRFDLVEFQQGNIRQVRRIIGLPGENIEYKEDTLYINSKKVDEKFIINEVNETQKNKGQYTKDFKLKEINNEYKIPDDCYLVLGDNREYGSDSRQYGLITKSQIRGVLEILLLPLNDIQNISRFRMKS